MKAEDVTTYSFNATYKRTLHGLTHTFNINRVFQIEILNEQIKSSSYDPNLGINIACHEILQRDYEIETEDIDVTFEKEFRKIEDFYRRINYRYDWIILRTLANGKRDSIQNKDELRKNWVELSDLIKNDYIGEPVNYYLQDIDSDFGRNNHFGSLFNQYFYFGLLFPPIPYHHPNTWMTERDMLLWETRNIGLRETLSFVSKEEGVRNYKIEAELLPGYPVILDQFDGYIKYSDKDKMVKEANLQLIYTNTGINKWVFELCQIENKTQNK